MKNYQTFSELDHKQMTEQRLAELRLFQFLLRNNVQLKEQYQDKAIDIADGIQPWIDALEIVLEQ